MLAVIVKLASLPAKSGDAGYRSLYLSHAERALYHLSYTPIAGAAAAAPRDSWRRVSGLVVEWLPATESARVRFPAHAFHHFPWMTALEERAGRVRSALVVCSPTATGVADS